MENASNALIMAAGVLIGVLILSLAIFLITDFGQTSSEINRRITDQQLVEFNANFTSYEGKEGLIIYDIVSVAGFARENNNYYDNQDYYKVTVKIGNKEIQNYSSDNLNNLIKEEQNTTPLPQYKCSVKEYPDNGRVKTFIFTKIYKNC